MIKADTNADETAKHFDKMANDMMEGVRRGIVKIQESIMSRSTSNYLQGPRPNKLDIMSRRLIRSMSGLLKYDGGTSSGTSFTIMRMTVSGRTVTAEYGTTAVSEDGYDYPGRWEYGSEPRPFMKPAIADTQHKYAKLMQDSIRYILRRASGGGNIT